MTDYNGWTNRETWLVVVHFSDMVADGLSWDSIEEMIEKDWNRITDFGFGLFFSDYLNLGLINWDEIKRSAYGEEEE